MFKRQPLMLLLLCSLVLLLSACGLGSGDEESPADTASAPEINVPNPTLARDAALVYVNQQYGERSPAMELGWVMAYVAPEDQAGSSNYEYTAESCTVTVSYPLVDPPETIFHVTMSDWSNGFLWEGEVDMSGQVRELVAPQAETTADPYAGWQSYSNARLGYRLMYPENASVTGTDPDQTVQFVGPVMGAEHWPWLFVDHYNNEFYRPPANVDLAQYITEAGIGYDALGSETTIAGLPAVHLVFDSAPGAFGRDDYYLLRQGQLFRISLLHTRQNPDWHVYNLFLQSFTFEGVTAPAGDDDAFSAWIGTVVRNPAGAQTALTFISQDGQQFTFGTVEEAPKTLLEQASWSGAQVQIWGNHSSELFTHLQITQVELVGGPAAEPRNLAYFAIPSASSVLPADRLGTYHAWSLIDGSPASPWAEGSAGSGVGEWVQLDFPGPVAVTHFYLVDGYDYDDDIFLANNRPKQVTLTFSGGEIVNIELLDQRGPQLITLAQAPGPGIVASWVRLTIDEVYAGSRYDDACIGELEVWGTVP